MMFQHFSIMSFVSCFFFGERVCYFHFGLDAAGFMHDIGVWYLMIFLVHVLYFIFAIDKEDDVKNERHPEKKSRTLTQTSLPNERMNEREKISK